MLHYGSSVTYTDKQVDIFWITDENWNILESIKAFTKAGNFTKQVYQLCDKYKIDYNNSLFYEYMHTEDSIEESKKIYDMAVKYTIKFNGLKQFTEK